MLKGKLRLFEAKVIKRRLLYQGWGWNGEKEVRRRYWEKKTMWKRVSSAWQGEISTFYYRICRVHEKFGIGKQEGQVHRLELWRREKKDDLEDNPIRGS